MPLQVVDKHDIELKRIFLPVCLFRYVTFCVKNDKIYDEG